MYSEKSDVVIHLKQGTGENVFEVDEPLLHPVRPPSDGGIKVGKNRKKSVGESRDMIA